MNTLCSSHTLLEPTIVSIDYNNILPVDITGNINDAFNIVYYQWTSLLTN